MKKYFNAIIVAILVASTLCSCSKIQYLDLNSNELSSEVEIHSSFSFTMLTVKTQNSISSTMNKNLVSKTDENDLIIDIIVRVSNVQQEISACDIFSSTAIDGNNNKYSSTNFVEINDYKDLSSDEILKKDTSYIVHIAFEVPKNNKSYLIRIKSGSKSYLCFKYKLEESFENNNKTALVNSYLEANDGIAALNIVKENTDEFSDDYLYYCKGIAYFQNSIYGDSISCLKKCSDDLIEAKNKKEQILNDIKKYNGTYKYQYRARRYSYIYIKNGYVCVSDSSIDKEKRKYNYQLVMYNDKMYIAKRNISTSGVKEKNLLFQVTFNTDNVGNELRVVVVGDKSTLLYNGSFEKC